MLIFTTSRKPKHMTRIIARTLANLIPGSRYIARGKAAVDSLAETASQLGYERIAIVGESHGNPAKISFADISKDCWDWNKAEVSIKSAEAADKKTKAGELKIEDSSGLKLEELFIAESEPEAEIALKADEKKMAFEKDGKKLLTIIMK
ncbi:MAG: hypothetical protein V1911_01575 [Candidatus Micrarchaeota archaeon]